MAHKYGAKKTTVDGVKFDSIAESRRYSELKLLERAGEITGLVLQPSFELMPKFEKRGVKYRAIVYRADFQYFDMRKAEIVVEDVKGFITKDFAIKHKIFEAKYPDLTLKIV